MAKDPFNVPKNEHGVVRVFTTDLEPRGNAAITPKNVQKLMGDEIELDPSGVEVFPSQMIESIGLTNYLVDGYGIPEGDLAGTAAALDAHAGLMILIRSSAFQGEATTLDPVAGIRFVGAFSEPANAPPKPMAEAAAAEGSLSPTGIRHDLPHKRVRNGWLIALVALFAAAGLVLFAVF